MAGGNISGQCDLSDIFVFIFILYLFGQGILKTLKQSEIRFVSLEVAFTSKKHANSYNLIFPLY